jgi:hypothetical protein
MNRRAEQLPDFYRHLIRVLTVKPVPERQDVFYVSQAVRRNGETIFKCGCCGRGNVAPVDGDTCAVCGASVVTDPSRAMLEFRYDQDRAKENQARAIHEMNAMLERWHAEPYFPA